MPREDRRIIFSEEELYHALYAHCRRADERRPPAGNITSVRFTDDFHENIEVRIENHVENEMREMLFTKAFVAAALIMYCRGVGIPIPKSASKSIDINKHGHILLRALM